LPDWIDIGWNFWQPREFAKPFAHQAPIKCDKYIPSWATESASCKAIAKILPITASLEVTPALRLGSFAAQLTSA